MEPRRRLRQENSYLEEYKLYVLKFNVSPSCNPRKPVFHGSLVYTVDYIISTNGGPWWC